MIVYFIQVKLAKDGHTLTMNLIANIMTYKTKKKMSSLILKKGVERFFKKKQQTKQQQIYKDS